MLFDKNGLSVPDTTYGYDFAVDFIKEDKSNKQLKIYSLSEALEKGNLFPNLYEGYANYKEREPVATTDKDAMLLEIQKLDFAINELNLYLDLHPEDKYAYYLFKDYTVEKTKKEANYTNIYGPLALTDLGEECELSLDYISEIESLKRRKSFSLAVLGRIADTLEIDIKEFFNKNNS